MYSSCATVTALASIYREHGRLVLFHHTMRSTKKRLDALIRRLPDEKNINKVVSYLIGKQLRYLDYKAVKRMRDSDTYRKSYMGDPKIFVYIPTYNRIEILLKRALPSVMQQTYKNIKVVVVDDGSTDNTSKIIKSVYGEKVEVLHNSRRRYRYPNKSFYHWLAGPVEAANKALAACDGEWIARIDDDDVWLPNHLEQNLKFAMENKLEFVSSKYRLINEEKNIDDEYGADSLNNIGGTQTWLYHSGLSSIRYNIHCWRKNYNKVNDTDLQNRMYEAGVCIGFNPIVTCTIRPRDNEEEVGSKAYLQNPRKYEDFYK